MWRIHIHCVGLFPQVWLESLAIVEGKNKQKVCAVGLTKVLCEYPPLLEEGREALWTRLMDALVRYLEGMKDPMHRFL